MASHAVARSRTGRHRELLKQGYVGARFARHVIERADHFILVAQIWAFLLAMAGGLVVARMVCVLKEHTAPFASSLSNAGVALFAALLLVFVLLASGLLVQLAKGIALSHPTRSTCWLSLLLIIIATPISPLVQLIRATVDRFLVMLGLGTLAERELALSADELHEVIEISGRAGEIRDDEKQMLQHVLAFSNTVVREVMTPRTDIISVQDTISFEDLLNVFLNERVSRVLVTGQVMDDVRGVILAKDLLYRAARPSNLLVKDLIRPAFFVSSSAQVTALFKEFRKEATHYAVVLDEHGGVDGVVTQEDLLEEIVGDILDEYDSPLDELDVFKTRSGDLLVDGGLLIEDLNTQYHFNIPLGEYSTIAGYLLQLFGRIPAPQDTIEGAGLRFQVEKVEHHRITQIRISPLHSAKKAPEP